MGKAKVGRFYSHIFIKLKPGLFSTGCGTILNLSGSFLSSTGVCIEVNPVKRSIADLTDNRHEGDEGRGGNLCQMGILCPYLHVEIYLMFLVSYGAYLEAISYFLLEEGIQNKKGKGIRKSTR